MSVQCVLRRAAPVLPRLSVAALPPVLLSPGRAGDVCRQAGLVSPPHAQSALAAAIYMYVPLLPCFSSTVLARGLSVIP